MTRVAYILFSIKWLLNIEIFLARVLLLLLLVYACYYWFLIEYSITDSTYKTRAFSYIFILNWFIHNSTDLAFTNFSLQWESNYFFFVASIAEYFLLMSSRNLFLTTGSMLSYICFFLCFLMMCFLSISVILDEQQINCISYFSLTFLFIFVWFLKIKVSKDILLSVKLPNSPSSTSSMCTFMLVPKIVTLSGRVTDVKQCLLCIVLLGWDPFSMIAPKAFAWWNDWVTYRIKNYCKTVIFVTLVLTWWSL